MRINVPKIVKNTSLRLLEAFVDSVFEFIDQPLLPSQVPLQGITLSSSNIYTGTEMVNFKIILWYVLTLIICVLQ